MRLRNILALTAVILLAAFLVVNWQVFAAPVTISLLVKPIVAPLGAVVLALVALAVIALVSLLGAWQGTLLVEFRRQAKELQAQRALAESAEASRFTELGALIRSELAASDQRVASALEGLRSELRETEGSIAATLAEMDDRYRRGSDHPAPR